MYIRKNVGVLIVLTINYFVKTDLLIVYEIFGYILFIAFVFHNVKIFIFIFYEHGSFEIKQHTI